MGKRSKVSPDQIQTELAATQATLPIFPILPDLFRRPKMFESVKTFRDEGFKLVEHSPDKIMSGTHKSAKGYIFKKYNNDKDSAKQIVNYMRRIEGAKLLRAFVEERHFQHVVVPRKWLYELPSSFPERYLLIAEKLDLVDDEASERAYARIGKEQMTELATILFYFRGLNSTTSNLPFTEDGQIAFIDTERWHHDKDYLRKIGDRISSDRIDLANDVYNALSRKRERQFSSQFE